MSEMNLSVPEVHCDHCVHSIQGAVGGLSGVDSVKVDLESRTVAVSYDDGAIDLDAITAAIEEQGYEVAGAV